MSQWTRWCDRAWITPFRFALLASICFVFAVSFAQEGSGTLDIYVIDVEGGEATLFVSPSGQALLVDAGWSGFGGRDADRIAFVANEAGVKQIDYLLVTHYHRDHMGGAMQLAERLPIRHFIDRGPGDGLSERGRAAFQEYAKLRDGGTHLVARPGDVIPIEGLDVRVVAVGGTVLSEPLPGAGKMNPWCDGFRPHGSDITRRGGDADDQLSLSAVVGYGAFRTIIMGDLTWNKEYGLMCPDNKVGTVDAYLVSHHGAETSGSQALVQALEPRAAIMNNGPRKGGAVHTFQILEQVRGLEDLWQNHYAVSAEQHNRDERFIANLSDGGGGLPNSPNGRPGHMGVANWLTLSARRDGSFTVTNSRNGFSRHYGSTTN